MKEQCELMPAAFPARSPSSTMGSATPPTWSISVMVNKFSDALAMGVFPFRLVAHHASLATVGLVGAVYTGTWACSCRRPTPADGDALPSGRATRSLPG